MTTAPFWRHGRTLRRLLRIFMPTVGFGACVGLIGDALNGTVLLSAWTRQEEFTWPAWGLGLLVVTAMGLWCAYLLYQKLPAELPVRTLTAPSQPSPHAVLIVLLAPSKPACRMENSSVVFLEKSGYEARRMQLGPDLAADLESLRHMPSWNWTQQMRSLQLHGTAVRRVYVVASAGPGGSHRDQATFAELLRHYHPGLEVETGTAVDFEDIDAVYRRLDECITAACAPGEEGPGYSQGQILIDATSGYKPASVAAGLVTLHNDVKLQYVTNSGQILAYAMTYEAAGALE